MKRFKNSIITRGIAVVSMVLGSIAIFSTSGFSQTVSSNDTALDRCLATQESLYALFLIDESKSLISTKNKDEPPTDPDHQRVPALKAVARTLNSLTKGDGAIAVSAAVSGFGEKFKLHRDWESVTDSTLEGLLTEIDQQANPERTNDIYTRYDLALNGALKKFGSIDQQESACRLLIWFSDGQHDSDNSTPLSSRERNEISREICAKDGLADQLRASGVFITAIGLNQDPEKLELMKLISENEGSFSNEDFIIDTCGERTSTGKFSAAENSTDIVDAINEASPGSPDQQVITSSCESRSEDCAEMRFTVDDSVFTFKAQITRPIASDVQAMLRTPNGTEISLFEIDGAVSADSVAFERLTPDKVFIVADSTSESSLDGEWLIQFSGSRAADVTGRVKFVGNAVVNVTNPDGSNVVSLDRFDPVPITIVVDSDSINNIIEGARVQLRSGADAFDLRPNVEEAGQFTVAASDIGVALKSPQLQDASAVTLLVDPQGYVSGLTGPNGEKVTVEYRPSASSQRILSVSNGSEFPVYLADKTATEMNSVKDTKTSKVKVWFVGPDANDGTVEFVSIDENDNQFELVSDSGSCLVPKQQEVACEFSIKPRKDGYGAVSVPVRAQLGSAGSSDQAEQLIPVSVKMTRGANVGKGVSQAILLLLLFVLVQAIIRLIFAWLVSRFAALSPTARKIRIPIVIDRNGGISGTSGQQLTYRDEDISFAFEAIDRSSILQIFEYVFATSPLRTFFKSTTTPQGYVTRDGYWLYGSSGVIQSKADKETGASQGVVSLFLRGEWVVGIPMSNIHALGRGQEQVEAELLAFLDDSLIKEFSEQLDEISYDINSGSLQTALDSAISEARAAEEEPMLPDEPKGAQSPTTVLEPAISDPNDPFATPPVSVIDTPVSDSDPAPKRRRNRRKKDKSTNDDDQSLPVDPFDSPFNPNDPFS